jgi:peptidoglycan hydrolase CwlO-like protein
VSDRRITSHINCEKRIAELEAENARLRADIDYSSLDAAIVREERLDAELDALDVKYVTVQHELAALKEALESEQERRCASCGDVNRAAREGDAMSAVDEYKQFSVLLKVSASVTGATDGLATMVRADAAVTELEDELAESAAEFDACYKDVLHFRKRAEQAEAELAALKAENERLNKAIDTESLTLQRIINEQGAELAALKALERFQHGVTTCPSCHAIMRWEQGEVVDWAERGTE